MDQVFEQQKTLGTRKILFTAIKKSVHYKFLEQFFFFIHMCFDPSLKQSMVAMHIFELEISLFWIIFKDWCILGFWSFTKKAFLGQGQKNALDGWREKNFFAIFQTLGP